MTTVAIYSMKGGVGKTTLAVALAWAAATRSSRRTLLWDLDAQAAASFILAPDRSPTDEARAVLERDIAPEKLIVRTAVRGLDLLPADRSLRALDTVFADIDRKKRLLRLTETLGASYDRILLDCPPGLGPASEQVMRGAALILLPMIPSTLSRRVFGEIRADLDRRHSGGPPVFPVFNMVDRRRRSHREALAADPGCPAIPMASAVEQMADRHAAIGAFAPRNPAARAIDQLWVSVEAKLAADARRKG